MLEAVIIGSGGSTPGRVSMRTRSRGLRRVNWRRTLAFTRKTSWVGTIGRVKSLDCSPKPGGFRASAPQSAWGDAWLRVRLFTCDHTINHRRRWIEGYDGCRPEHTRR